MSVALRLDATNGQYRKFTASDQLEIDDIIRLSASGDMTIGSNLGATEELKLGSASSKVRILGDFEVDGSEIISVTETVVGTFTASGDIHLGQGDDGDTIAIGSGTNDTVTLNSDLRLGSPAGVIQLGQSVTEYLGKIWLEAIGGDSGPDNAAYNLNTSGVDAGAYAIGVDPARVSNSAAANLMDMLVDLDGAISAGSPNLQSAYTAGNTIDVATADEELKFRNNTDSIDVLQISRAPSSSTGGRGCYISMGANTTGRALHIVQEGSGDALAVYDGAVQVFTISGTGALTANMPATSAITTTAGNLSLSADAGELQFNDVGGSYLEFSQVADRALDETGAGEVLEGATSVVGAINRLARSITTVGGSNDEAPIQDGVTIAAGYVVAQSTATGRVTNAVMDANTNSKTVGIAITGGTGDAGGTVSCKFALPGTKVTVSGASWTTGAALFAPETAGIPVMAGSAPSDPGDAFQFIGYARNATTFVFDPQTATIL